MTIHVAHAEIVERLRAGALDSVNTGWLSNLAHFDPEYDDEESAIQVSGPELGSWGSIDLGQLARIVQDLIKEVTA